MAEEKRFRVPKSELDPFGAREQAVGRVRRRAEHEMGPNVESLEYDVRDDGDHFEVRVRAHESMVARRRSQNRRSIERAGRTKLDVERSSSAGGESGWLSLNGPGFLEDGGPPQMDPASVLEANMSINEVRSELSRRGHYYPQTADKGDLVEILLEQEPARARRLAGV